MLPPHRCFRVSLRGRWASANHRLRCKSQPVYSPSHYKGFLRQWFRPIYRLHDRRARYRLERTLPGAGGFHTMREPALHGVIRLARYPFPAAQFSAMRLSLMVSG